MNRIALIVAALLIGVMISHYRDTGVLIDGAVVAPSRHADDSNAAASGFSCDGRKRCSQMTSCAEARYFLDHCPNVQMDGDNDGIPCEGQWCGN